MDNSVHTTALFVSGSPEGVSETVLQALASECDFILAVDAGANQLRKAGITPHLLIGDFDSIDSAVLKDYQSKGIEIQSYDAYKNSTDVELGLEALVSRGFKRIIATNVLGGRTDHALGSLGALAKVVRDDAVEVILRDEHELCYFVSGAEGEVVLELDFAGESEILLTPQRSRVAGTPIRFAQNDKRENAQYCKEEVDQRLCLPKHLSLVSWGGANTVSFTGTEWELDHYCLTPYSARGISNLARLPVVRLVVHGGAGVVLMLLTLKH